MKKLAVTLGFLTFSQSTKAHAFNQTDDSLAGETRKNIYISPILELEFLNSTSFDSG